MSTPMSTNPLRDPQDRRLPKVAGPCGMVIFGVTGDLSRKKVMPAIYDLASRGLLPPGFSLVGYARRDWADQDFAQVVHDSVKEHARTEFREEVWDQLSEGFRFVSGDFSDDRAFDTLRQTIQDLDRVRGTGGNHAFYLSIPPRFFPDVIGQLKEHGLAEVGPDSWRRVVVEKPFGSDLKSARALNATIHEVFPPESVFRIDHYLGKETVQNILVFRFGNGIFEPIWNRNYIDHVQITAAETLGVEGRGPFYEKAGALRDVVQNHVMELLSFVTMEPPSSFEAEAVRREKVKVWRAIPSIPIKDAVRGQYGPGVVEGKKVVGYRDEDRVNPESGTETYAAVKLGIENWRWAGVPFYLRAGKRMKKRATEISIQFKQPPLLIFNRMQASGPCNDIQPNLLTIRIQPNEGIALRFGAKVPNTPNMSVCPVNMDFDYAAAFGTSTANGYERLLLDAMLGDQTLFAHRDGVEVTWSLYTPILEAWAAKNPEVFPNYFAGTWGPDCSDRLLEREGHVWRNNVG
jgi:glucose-6-phosphate 1-dehydrogenase